MPYLQHLIHVHDLTFLKQMNKITLSPKRSPGQIVTCKSSSSPKAMICHPGKLCFMPGGAQLLFKQNTVATILFWGWKKATQLLPPNIKGGVVCKKIGQWGRRKGIESRTKNGTSAEYALSGTERNQEAHGDCLTQSWLLVTVGHRLRWVTYTPKLLLIHGISGKASLTPNKSMNNCHPRTLLATPLTPMRF